MNDHTPNTIGVDISKAHLDAHRLATGEARRFANDAAGIKALAAWAGPDAERVVHESTGPWHRALEEALAATLPLSRVNATRARRFAQAMGQAAKTDAVDAGMLARMGAALDLRRVEARSPTERDLDEPRTARDALVRDRTAALNRQKHVRHPLLGAATEEPAGPDRPADQGIGRRGREADRRRRGADTQGRGAGLRARDRLGHRRGPARGDAGAGHDRRQGGRQPGGPGADDARVGGLEGAELYPRRPGQAAAACSTWRRSARSATTRISAASTGSCANGASRRRWPSRRSCASWWCWPTRC